MPDFKVYDVRGRFPVLPSHVHGYAIETPRATVVVDATAAISSGNELRGKAEATGKPLQGVLMTHGHPDHFTGLTQFADVPRYASQTVIEFAHREDETKWEAGKMYLGDDFPDKRVFPETAVKDGDTLNVGGLDFRFVELGPGESESDCYWMCEAEGKKHVFIGDTISSGVHSFFGDGQALNWLKVLDRLERTFDKNTTFYVGHGDSPVGYDHSAWQRGYVQTFLDMVKSLPREDVVSEETQAKVIKAMQGYLPAEGLLFLLGYELDQGIKRVWKALDSGAPAQRSGASHG